MLDRKQRIRNSHRKHNYAASGCSCDIHGKTALLYKIKRADLLVSSFCFEVNQLSLSIFNLRLREPPAMSSASRGLAAKAAEPA